MKLRGSVVNFILWNKVSVEAGCSHCEKDTQGKVVQRTETMLSKLATFPVLIESYVE